MSFFRVVVPRAYIALPIVLRVVSGNQYTARKEPPWVHAVYRLPV